MKIPFCTKISRDLSFFISMFPMGPLLLCLRVFYDSREIGSTAQALPCIVVVLLSVGSISSTIMGFWFVLFVTARKRSLRRLCFYRCLSVDWGRGGMCVVAPGGGHAWLLPGGHAWLLPGGGMRMVAPRGCVRGCSWGGMRGCSRGACMVAPRGGHARLLRGVCVWLLPGGHACLLWGGMCGCSWGACMVALGGHAWLLWGGMCGCSQGGRAWLLGGRAWFFR